MGNLLRRRVMQAVGSGGGADPIDQYVQNGLILWLDGIRNTRAGHDPNAEAWEDLSGNGRDCTYYSASLIGDKYCQPNGCMTTGIELPPIAPGTIEIVLERTTLSTQQMILPYKGNAYGTVGLRASNDASGYPCALHFAPALSNTKVIETPSGVHSYSANSSTDLRRDNASPQIATTNASWSGTNRSILFAYSTASSYPCRSKIYALRIYSRTLTEDELTINWLLDRERFNIE